MISGAPPREDLLALTADTLAALANRGLVKRAVKDLDAGTGPEVRCEDDGTVSAVHPDGSRTRLPVGVGLETTECSCTASGVCRHRTTDPITRALESGLSVLADLAHAGLRGLGRSARDRLGSAAAELRRTGLHEGAALVQTVATTLDVEGAESSPATWVDATIQLLVSLELHQEADAP